MEDYTKRKKENQTHGYGSPLILYNDKYHLYNLLISKRLAQFKET